MNINNSKGLYLFYYDKGVGLSTKLFPFCCTEDGEHLKLIPLKNRKRVKIINE